MGLENDLERQLSDSGKSFEVWAGKSGQSLMKNWSYGLREIMAYRYLKKEDKSIKYGNLAIVVCVTGALFFYAPELAKLVPAKVAALHYKDVIILKILHMEWIYKVIGLIVPATFLNVLGVKKLEEIQSYNDRFEMIGLSSGSKKTIVDGDGQKIRVMAFPELIRKIEVNEDTDMYLFKPNGNSLDAFMKKRENLEQVFNTNIYKIDYTKGSKNVIRMVTVTNEKKAEIMELYEEQVKFNEKFERIGIVGKGQRVIKTFGGVEETIKNYPEYLGPSERTVNNKKVTTYKFRSEGTEIQNWRDKKYLFENVLNLIVVDIKQSLTDKQIFELETISLADDLKPLYSWDDAFTDVEDGVLVLGEGQLDKVKINLNDLPHMLIGGTTGSGKSVLTNCLAWQIILKGCHLVPIDFKGGVELEMLAPFAPVLFERPKVIKVLDKLVKEHEARLEEFKRVNVKKITDYNKVVGEELAMARVVILVDEIAEMLGKTGDKGVDAEIEVIESKLNTLARLSRATGINIITATQRPDAKVLGGQIKNNLPVRVCGRMVDPQPSIMVLDSPEATNIPKEIKGRYMINTGSGIQTFQAYFFKESSIVPGDYRRGRLLVMESSAAPIKRNNQAVVEDFTAPNELNFEKKFAIIPTATVDDDEEDDEDDNNENPYDDFDENLHDEEHEETEVIHEIFSTEDLHDPDEAEGSLGGQEVL